MIKSMQKKELIIICHICHICRSICWFGNRELI